MQRWLSIGFLCAVAFAATATPAAADIYRSVDKDGVVHFTNTPKPGQRWQRVVRSQSRPVKTQSDALSRLRPVQVAPGGKGQQPTHYEPIIQEAARLYQLPPALILAVTRVESGFNPNVVSNKGAMGLMQLMPGTAVRMGVQNPFDPRENLLGGARYLRVLANMFGGDIMLTVAGYNAGENAVLKYGGIPPYSETQRYVRNVLRNYYAFRERDIIAALNP